MWREEGEVPYLLFNHVSFQRHSQRSQSLFGNTPSENDIGETSRSQSCLKSNTLISLLCINDYTVFQFYILKFYYSSRTVTKLQTNNQKGWALVQSQPHNSCIVLSKTVSDLSSLKLAHYSLYQLLLALRETAKTEQNLCRHPNVIKGLLMIYYLKQSFWRCFELPNIYLNE